MRLRCSGASQGDCIKTMARLLRRNKGGWQQNQKQTAQFAMERSSGPPPVTQMRCGSASRHNHSDAQWGAHQDPSMAAQSAQKQKGSSIKTQAWMMGYQDPRQTAQMHWVGA